MLKKKNDWDLLMSRIEFQGDALNTNKMLIVRIHGFGENNPCSGCKSGVFNGTKEIVVREIVLSANGKAIQYDGDINVAGRKAFDWDDISEMVTELNCRPDIEQILLCYKEHGKINYVNKLMSHVRKSGKLMREIPTILSLPQQRISYPVT